MREILWRVILLDVTLAVLVVVCSIFHFWVMPVVVTAIIVSWCLPEWLDRTPAIDEFHSGGSFLIFLFALAVLFSVSSFLSWLK